MEKEIKMLMSDLKKKHAAYSKYVTDVTNQENPIEYDKKIKNRLLSDVLGAIKTLNSETLKLRSLSKKGGKRGNSKNKTRRQQRRHNPKH